MEFEGLGHEELDSRCYVDGLFAELVPDNVAHDPADATLDQGLEERERQVDELISPPKLVDVADPSELNHVQDHLNPHLLLNGGPILFLYEGVNNMEVVETSRNDLERFTENNRLEKKSMQTEMNLNNW